MLPSPGISLPVRYKGEEVGVLSVAPRGPGERFSTADERVIEEIARQMGIVVNSVLQAEDLRRSRERLVTTREEERRRIRRDLHDGLGPSLAALSLQVEIARDLVVTDPERSAELLDAVLVQTREAIDDIRRLVYGLRPPALDDLGLLGAIRAQRTSWEQHGLEVTLDLPADLPNLSAAIEVAIYRITQEAMNNVIRHAGASAVSVGVRLVGGEICLTVADDGRGLPAIIAPGIGMLSIRERSAELGGRCTIRPGGEGGVTVEARFALPAETREGER
jgi:signal transduction histidine kinase